MPLVASAMKKKFKATIKDGLKREFGSAAGKGTDYPPIAEEQWDKLANAISDIAADIVSEITTNALVMPGQMVVGTFVGVGSGPTQGTTISPGNIK